MGSTSLAVGTNVVVKMTTTWHLSLEYHGGFSDTNNQRPLAWDDKTRGVFADTPFTLSTLYVFRCWWSLKCELSSLHGENFPYKYLLQLYRTQVSSPMTLMNRANVHGPTSKLATAIVFALCPAVDLPPCRYPGAES